MRSDASKLLQKLGRQDFIYKEFDDAFADMDLWPIFEALLTDPRVVGRPVSALDARTAAQPPAYAERSAQDEYRDSGDRAEAASAHPAHVAPSPPNPPTGPFDRYDADRIAGDHADDRQHGADLRAFFGRVAQGSGRGNDRGGGPDRGRGRRD